MIFGSEKNNREEIGLIWERLVPIERKNTEFDKKFIALDEKLDLLEAKAKQPSESQKDAQTASRSAIAYRSNIKKIKEEIEKYADSIKAIHTSVSSSKTSIEENLELVTNSQDKSIELLHKIQSIESETEELKSSLQANVDILVTTVDEHSDLPTKLVNALESIDELEGIETKAQGILKNIASHHSKIKELRQEILGYDTESDTGEIEHIEGLKDELEISFNELKKNYSDFNQELIDYKKVKTEQFESLVSKSEKDIEELRDKYDISHKEQLSNHNNQHNEVYNRIIKLLPDALTAGLSSAYDEKTLSEKTEMENHKKTFTNAIRSLVAISLVPFAVDLYLLIGLNKDLLAVLSDTPKIILSILPLYLPVLWIAYSANKKANLSKRLIEEYTHKGVLSKTFEGLSTQIEELKDGDLSNELRVKLLFNILHVNAENPGKLISDYKTTDHPIMDALDKSVKLGNAVDKLKNIPGFSNLITKLDKESQDILIKTAGKVETGLQAKDSIIVKSDDLDSRSPGST
ncbi:hypothetical protein I6F53_05760 [Pseudoalteromonas sp. SWN29]|uniref:hypothetical protein n=1 Tax=Pseudoalteromonas sp. SWN29 TaxID=2792064 RepID=UPI0018CCF766|nr:hypothetical protein [Pseudoalteromonas sp. SWN29]MBH0026483.1 hypothetical protein [Pseudoalteromonas sp. SWN29]